MEQNGTTSRSALPRWAIVVGVIFAAGAAAGGYVYRPTAQEPVKAGPMAPIAAVGSPPAAPGPAPHEVAPAVAPVPAVAPSFDVVRVSPSGTAVIAGRAEAGSDVVVMDGTTEVARARADSRGEFVALPSAPLAEGGRALTLASRDGAGAETKGDGAVMVVIPPRAAGVVPEVPVAVLVPNAAPARVMQPVLPAGRAVTLDVVDYDDAGAIRFSGGAAPSSMLRVYVDNGGVGDALAGADGRWVLSPKDAVSPGVHRVRVDSLDGAGRVTGRIEMPFERSSIAVAALGAGRAVVQPGQNLWRLARAAYGSGVRYTVIYLANREQIKDPNRIYPGQAFTMPVQRR